MIEAIDRISSQLNCFHDSQFPASRGKEAVFGFIPGRIEVFGRHTDYAGGRSLVCSIDRGFLFAATANNDGVVRMAEESSEFEPVEFPVSSSLTPRQGQWANYPMTMTRRVSRNFGQSLRLQGADIAFSSSLPVGSGMSGSSALMMMTFAALATLNRLHETPPFRENIRDPVDLAVYLACAENGQGFRGLEGDSGVGTFGGSEDHAAIVNARTGLLSLFGFRPASLQEEIGWPRGWRMVVAFSGARAEKTREALEKYNLASRRAAEAVRRYNRAFGTRLETLREIADVEKGSAGADRLLRLDGKGARWPGLADRVRQFILEDRRYIPGALRAIREKDLAGFGKLLSASHRASRRFLWNIVPEIDFLQRSAVREGAVGASGFGAGFGGSIFAVVEAGAAKSFMARWQAQYVSRYARHALEAAFFIARPSTGMRLLEGGGSVRLADRMFQV